MKTRVVCLVLACLLCFCCTVVSAQVESFNVVQAQLTENGVEITCYLWGEASEITYLVYQLNQQGKKGELVQVGEKANPPQGLFTIALPVAHCEQGFYVCVSATGVGTPRKVAVTKEGYTFACWGMVQNQTVQAIENAVTPLDVTVMREENTVSPTNVVLQGDLVVTSAQEYTVVCFGDVNFDHSIDAKDALAILRYAVKKIEFTQLQILAADWEQDHKIDATDALNLLKFAVGKAQCL